jgi:hypothetical protein
MRYMAAAAFVRSTLPGVCPRRTGPPRVGYCLPWFVSGVALVVNFMPTTPGDFAAADRTDSEENARISHGWSGEVHTLFGRERSQCVFQLSTQTI